MDCQPTKGNPGRIRRYPVVGCFAILGLVCSGCAAAIPEIKATLGLDDAQLGRLLLAGPVGTALSYPIGGLVISRFGSRVGAIVGCTGYLLAFLTLAACLLVRPPVQYWALSMGLVPAFGNMLNISANTQAGLVERRAGRSMMSFFHAQWSVANIAGGVLLLAATGWCGAALGWCLAAIAAMCAGIAAAVFAKLDPDTCAAAVERRSARRPRFDRALLALGLVSFLFVGCEGSVTDWVGVFYRDYLKVPANFVLVGYCAVMAMMTVGRFLTDRLVDRTSPTFVLRLYSALVACGLGAAMLCATGLPPGHVRLVAVTCGYAVAGIGLSGLSPIVCSQATKSTTVPAGTAVTIVSSIGFLAYFLTPPLIGSLSQRFGLAAALGAYAVIVLTGLFVRLGKR